MAEKDEAPLELRKFEVKEVKVTIGYGTLRPIPMNRVICPHCKAGFLVGIQHFSKSEYTGRPCPCCFKVAGV